MSRSGLKLSNPRNLDNRICGSIQIEPPQEVIIILNPISYFLAIIMIVEYEDGG